MRVERLKVSGSHCQINLDSDTELKTLVSLSSRQALIYSQFAGLAEMERDYHRT